MRKRLHRPLGHVLLFFVAFLLRHACNFTAPIDGRMERRSRRAQSKAAESLSSQSAPLQPLLANASELTATLENEDAEYWEVELRANSSLLEILEEAPLYSAARSKAAALFDRLSDNATLGLSYARILKFMPRSLMGAWDTIALAGDFKQITEADCMGSSVETPIADADGVAQQPRSLRYPVRP